MPLNIESLGKHLAASVRIYDRAGFYDKPEAELWGALGLHIPSQGDLALGVDEIHSYRRSVIGRASISDGVAFDVPLVDFAIKGSKAKTQMVIAGAEWSLGEVSRAQVASRAGLEPVYNFVQMKQEAIKIACDRRVHELIYAGNLATGFYGFFNNPEVPPIDETATQVMQLTPMARYDWMHRVLSQFKMISKLSYASVTAFVSDDLYTGLAKRFTDGTGDSAMLLLSDSTRGRFLGTIEPLTELAPAFLASLGIVPNANTGLMILGDFDARSVKRHFLAQDRTDPFIKESGIHWGVTGWQATSEVDFKVPERFAYVKYGATPPV